MLTITLNLSCRRIRDTRDVLRGAGAGKFGTNAILFLIFLSCVSCRPYAAADVLIILPLQ